MYFYNQKNNQFKYLNTISYYTNYCTLEYIDYMYINYHTA